MSEVVIQVEGTATVISNLVKHNEQFRNDLTKVVRKAATDVRKTGKQLAPDGRPWKSNWRYAAKHKKINQSISARFTGSGNNDLKGIRSTVGPGKQAYQRAFFAHGTKDRYLKNGRYVGKMKPVHYMEKAQSEHEAEYKGSIKRLVEQHVEL